tara:strand:- start:49 stop:183 length:135 start_codon:yes stop_codon:yes gene_type:complete
MTDGEIYHEYILLQLASDAAENAVFEFYAENKSAIVAHIESFSV